MRVGSRPDISVYYQKNMDLYLIKHPVSRVGGAVDTNSNRYPGAADAAKSQLGVGADGSTGKLKNDICVDPRVGRLWVLGGSSPGGRYHFLRPGSGKLGGIVMSSITHGVLAMAHASDSRTQLSSTLGGICSSGAGAVAINDCFSLLSFLCARKAFRGGV